ncbi:MAG: DUF2339 domain-containing protein [Candidatus Woesearchaeota archaeon]|jgi:uncharacterized membrane protein|nr:DUF2339 domain-containing protein [Candidatus Woesearchaeota archaeon]
MNRVLEILENQEKRIQNIEKNLNIEPLENTQVEAQPSAHENEVILEKPKQYKSNLPNFSFNQVISFIGILGIIIGCISFFFYAVAKDWIGPTAQVMIGVILGLILFVLAFSLEERNREWSLIVFGGSFFIEFLSIFVGVIVYKVIPEIIGFIVLLLFTAVAIALSIKFNSKIIAYYSLIGGYLIPIITNTHSEIIFMIMYVLLLNVSLLVLSSRYNWVDLRFTSFIILWVYIVSSFSIYRLESIGFALFFLISVFLINNIMPLVYSVLKKEEINALDSIIFNVNLLFFAPMLYTLLKKFYNIGMIEFGFVILLVAFLYLVEILVLKIKLSSKVYMPTLYSILSGAVITLNLGIFLVLNTINEDFFMVLFLIQWIFFAYMSKFVEESEFYNIVSNIFLALIAIWYLFVLRFDEGLLHATLFLFVLLAIIPGFLFLIKQDINKRINSGLLAISIFLILLSVSKYMMFFIDSEAFYNIVLSVMWLVYTLIGIIKFDKIKEAKILFMVLLGITVLKIAFVDLLFLEGAFRIIGFIVFGILLLIGSYFMKNEKSN